MTITDEKYEPVTGYERLGPDIPGSGPVFFVPTGEPIVVVMRADADGLPVVWRLNDAKTEWQKVAIR